MIRQSSIDAYHQIKDSGLLNQIQDEVLKVITDHGPITQGETWYFHFSDRQRHDVCPRFAELLAKGAIKCLPRRPCRYTGRSVQTWDVNEAFSVQDTLKKLTKTEIISMLMKAIDDLKSENVKLTKLLQKKLVINLPKVRAL